MDTETFTNDNEKCDKICDKFQFDMDKDNSNVHSEITERNSSTPMDTDQSGGPIGMTSSISVVSEIRKCLQRPTPVYGHLMTTDQPHHVSMICGSIAGGNDETESINFDRNNDKVNMAISSEDCCQGNQYCFCKHCSEIDDQKQKMNSESVRDNSRIHDSLSKEDIPEVKSARNTTNLLTIASQKLYELVSSSPSTPEPSPSAHIITTATSTTTPSNSCYYSDQRPSSIISLSSEASSTHYQQCHTFHRYSHTDCCHGNSHMSHSNNNTQKQMVSLEPSNNNNNSNINCNFQNVSSSSSSFPLTNIVNTASSTSLVIRSANTPVVFLCRPQESRTLLRLSVSLIRTYQVINEMYYSKKRRRSLDHVSPEDNSFNSHRDCKRFANQCCTNCGGITSNEKQFQIAATHNTNSSSCCSSSSEINLSNQSLHHCHHQQHVHHLHHLHPQQHHSIHQSHQHSHHPFVHHTHPYHTHSYSHQHQHPQHQHHYPTHHSHPQQNTSHHHKHSHRISQSSENTPDISESNKLQVVSKLKAQKHSHNHHKHLKESQIERMPGAELNIPKCSQCNSNTTVTKEHLVKPGEVWMNRYSMDLLIGTGSFGQVVRANDLITGEPVAIKIIRNRRSFVQQAETEIRLLRMLARYQEDQDTKNMQHWGANCIVRLKSHFMYRGHLCLVFELLTYSLYELLRNTGFSGVSLHLTRKFALQICSALHYLGQSPLHIIHCDLKPENVLLVHPRRSAIKLVDFGSSCRLNERLYVYIQSRFYRAPEVLLYLPYSMAIDMWSLGCVLVELHTGQPLFVGQYEHEQILKIIEVIGMPPDHMIRNSKRANKYFMESDSLNKSMDATFETENHCFEPKVFRNRDGKRIPFEGVAARKLNEIVGAETGGPDGRRRDEPGHSPQDYACFLDLVRKMLTIDPSQRITPDEALKHPFFTSSQPSMGNTNSNSISNDNTLLKSEPSSSNNAAADLEITKNNDVTISQNSIDIIPDNASALSTCSMGNSPIN